jgi:hypothetical protein
MTTSCESDDNLRGKPDRRRQPTPLWAVLGLNGRRMRCRRAAEHAQPYFVDRFPPVLLLAIMLLIFASILDGVITLQIIQAGGDEVNPVMDRLLDHGAEPFLLGKYLLTVAGLPLLLIFRNYFLFGTRLRVGHLIPVFVGLYAVLLTYQCCLIHLNNCPI